MRAKNRLHKKSSLFFFIAATSTIIINVRSEFSIGFLHSHRSTRTPLLTHSTHATCRSCIGWFALRTVDVLRSTAHTSDGATGGRGYWNEPNIIYKSTSKPFSIFSLNLYHRHRPSRSSIVRLSHKRTTIFCVTTLSSPIVFTHIPFEFPQNSHSRLAPVLRKNHSENWCKMTYTYPG